LLPSVTTPSFAHIFGEKIRKEKMKIKVPLKVLGCSFLQDYFGGNAKRLVVFRQQTSNRHQTQNKKQNKISAM